MGKEGQNIIKQLQRDIGRLQNELDGKYADKEEIEGDIASLENEIEELYEEISDIERNPQVQEEPITCTFEECVAGLAESYEYLVMRDPSEIARYTEEEFDFLVMKRETGGIYGGQGLPHKDAQVKLVGNFLPSRKESR